MARHRSSNAALIRPIMEYAPMLGPIERDEALGSGPCLKASLDELHAKDSDGWLLPGHPHLIWKVKRYYLYPAICVDVYKQCPSEVYRVYDR
ncbi:hypothetical protein TNCV_4810711 [Trichonephila clavipes]|nr:hypothetical protein TNCV_4810711 [Trichonephila clavipes]